jgi:hypothetical protein
VVARVEVDEEAMAMVGVGGSMESGCGRDFYGLEVAMATTADVGSSGGGVGCIGGGGSKKAVAEVCI